MYPYSNPSILSKGIELIKTIKWGSILDGTQKTLGVINQAIPIIYQVKPIVSNAKSIFNIANSLKNDNTDTSISTNEKIEDTSSISPVFYL